MACVVWCSQLADNFLLGYSLRISVQIATSLDRQLYRTFITSKKPATRFVDVNYDNLSRLAFESCAVEVFVYALCTALGPYPVECAFMLCSINC